MYHFHLLPCLYRAYLENSPKIFWVFYPYKSIRNIYHYESKNMTDLDLKYLFHFYTYLFKGLLPFSIKIWWIEKRMVKISNLKSQNSKFEFEIRGFDLIRIRWNSKSNFIEFESYQNSNPKNPTELESYRNSNPEISSNPNPSNLES